MSGHQEAARAKILVVEDEAIIALDLKSHLEQLGYSVLAQVDSAEKVLELIEQDPPDLVLMDIILKGKMDGIEAADIIHTRWGVPVVFVTAYTDQRRLERAKRAHPFGYIVKPFQDDDLKVTVEMALYISRVDRERKKAEEALRKSEEYFKTIIQHSSDIILVVDKLGTITYVSPSVERFLGYGPDELIGKSTLDLIMPDDQPRAIADFGKALLTKEVPVPNVFRIRPKNGTERILEGIGKNLLDNPLVAGFVMNVRDITDRKRMEEKLQLHAEIERNMSEAVCLIRTNDALIVYTNPSFDLMFGYDPGELIGRHVSLVNTPGDKTSEAAANEIISSLAKTGMWSNEILNRRKDGTVFWCQTNVITFEHPRYGQVWLSMHKDITERKRAEEALRESKERFRLLIEQAPDAIAVFDVDEERFVLANAKAEELFGCRREGLLKYGPHYFYTPIQPDGRPLDESIKENIERVLAGEEVVIERAIHNAEGRELICELRIVRLPSADRRLIRNSYVDITERKRAEEALRESEASYRDLFENANEGIFVAQGGKLVFFNPRAVMMSGYSAEELWSRPYIEFIHPDDRDVVIDRQVRQRKGEELPPIYEVRIIHKDGNVRWVELNVVTINWKGRPASLNFQSDITERKQAEEKIKTSLLEKETMLKEIHHRVKNNLQVIQSLLTLQARKIKDPQALEVIEQSRDRIRSMSLVHEKLYRSPDLAQIDMADFLRNLSISLFHSFRVNPDTVNLKVEVEEVQVGIDKAVPLGLIINELVSNGLKHAFPAGIAGEIRVGLALVDDGMIRLSVGDNGIGFPRGVDFRETDSMGFQVVISLVRQLDGAIGLHQEVGTEFRITFPR
jgi:PAS domain S-box-containing protein